MANGPCKNQGVRGARYTEFEQDSIQDKDTIELAKVGKKQVLKRRFGFMSIVGFSCTILVTWEGVLEQFMIGFSNGGPAGLIYGFVIVALGTLSAFTTIAEMASMAPVSGGQYHWVSMLAPQSYQKFLSYVTGWLMVAGWQTAAASIGYLSGTTVQGLIVLNNPSYVFQRWHGTLLYWACTLFAVCMNTFISSSLPVIERVFLILHLFGFFLILIPMVYLGPHSSNSDVFTVFLNEGGWSTKGLSFFVGLTGNVFSLVGADGAVHMCEEIQNACMVVPRSILVSLGLNSALGLGMLIGVLYCLGDVEAAFTTPTKYPFIEIFMQATNSRQGSLAMAAIVLIMGIFCQVAILAVASRVLWAFARDRGVPGWRRLCKIDPRSSIPISAVITSTFISCALALVNIGSAIAMNDIISISVSGLYSSYLICCSLLLWRRCTGIIRQRSDNGPTQLLSNTGEATQLVWGPWRLSKTLGIINNVFAVVYLAMVLFFTFWPYQTHPTAEEMNYAVLTTGAVVGLGIVYYLLWGRKTYGGPVVEIGG